MRFPARIVGVIFAFLLIFFVSKVSFAQTAVNEPNQTPQYLAPNASPEVPSNLHTWTQSVMIEVLSSMVCQLTGVDVVNKNQPCLGINSQTGQIGYEKNTGGLIGLVTTMIGYTYVIPVHAGDYFAAMGSHFGIAKTTYAANIDGVQALSYVQSAWITFRNFAYILFVFIFVLIGLAIMLRIRIDPRTVMTIQNQIPKLIVGIILVTFSFAIAGLLIDFMWIAIYFMINTLHQADANISAVNITAALNTSAPNFVNNSNTVGPDGGILGVASNVSLQIGGLVSGLLNSGSQPGGNALDLLTNPIGTVVGAILGAIAGVLAFFIIAIALLWALLRLWFSLIKAYISILIDVIFAPFWIMAGLVPGVGQSVGIGAWLRDIIANLAVFPAVITMLAIGKLLVDSLSNGAYNGTTSFTPPLIGSQLNGEGLGSLIMLGIILASPSVAESIKKAVKASGTGFGLGKGLGAGQAVVGAVGGSIWQRLYFRHYDQETHGYRTGGAIGSNIDKIFRRSPKKVAEIPNTGSPGKGGGGEGIGL